MNLTRRGALVGAMGTFGALAAGPVLARASLDWSSVDALAAKVVADGLTPALSLAFAKHGEILFSKAYGLANLETGAAATTTGACRIGSVTKQFTAAAILLLAEDGKLSIDDRLSKFVPDFPRAADITLRQMLGHTSGLGNYTDTTPPEKFLQNSRTDYDRAGLLAALKVVTPVQVFEPGAAWAYSNTAYVLLGLVIETASGMPWGAFMKARIFDPLGLTRTAEDNAADVVPGRYSGYSAKPKGGWENASFISMTFPGAAGALRSTPEEVCRWQAALLGGKLLKPDSLKAMTTPVRLNNGELPTAPGGAPDAPKVPLRYGFGLQIGDLAGKPFVGHGGGIQGFSSFSRTYTALGFNIATVVNCDSQPDGPDKLGPALSAVRAEAMKVFTA